MGKIIQQGVSTGQHRPGRRGFASTKKAALVSYAAFLNIYKLSISKLLDCRGFASTRGLSRAFEDAGGARGGAGDALRQADQRKMRHH